MQFRMSPGGRIRFSRRDRKSTRLNSSHGYISYAVFCLKKKKNYYARPNNYHKVFPNNCSTNTIFTKSTISSYKLQRDYHSVLTTITYEHDVTVHTQHALDHT